MSTEKSRPDLNVTSVASADDSSRVSDTLRVVTSHPLSITDVAEELTTEQKLYILKKLNYDTLVTLDDLPV
ncbi:hypothetical protein OXX69_010753, partial [Metschnikowia pulcherrima]